MTSRQYLFLNRKEIDVESQQIPFVRRMLKRLNAPLIANTYITWHRIESEIWNKVERKKKFRCAWKKYTNHVDCVLAHFQDDGAELSFFLQSAFEWFSDGRKRNIFFPIYFIHRTHTHSLIRIFWWYDIFLYLAKQLTAFFHSPFRAFAQTLSNHKLSMALYSTYTTSFTSPNRSKG